MMGLGVPYRFVAKNEVHNMPFIGTFLRKMEHLSFVRTDTDSRRDAVQQIEAILRQGDSVFVFPEGTFVPEDGVRPFQLGAFNASVVTGAPIVPVSLAGTRRFLRDGTILPRPTSITITLSAPIYPRRDRSVTEGDERSNWHELIQLRDETRAAIAQHVPEPLL